MNIIQIMRENIKILQHLDSGAGGITRKSIFDKIDAFDGSNDVLKFKEIIHDILVWGAYKAVTKRDVKLVVNQIDQDYVSKFTKIMSDDVLTAKELFNIFNKDLKLGGMRLDGIRFSYFTKFIYFFTQQNRGLAILDKHLAEGGLKLAYQLKDAEYFNAVIDVVYNKKHAYSYSSINSDTYQCYCDFMKRAVTKLKEEHELTFDSVADLELVLFGWGKRRKQLNGYSLVGLVNPRSVLQKFSKII